jgi:hypothetical protein
VNGHCPACGYNLANVAHVKTNGDKAEVLPSSVPAHLFVINDNQTLIVATGNGGRTGMTTLRLRLFGRAGVI